MGSIYEKYNEDNHSIVPFMFFSGMLLLRKNNWGYLFASIAVIKAAAMSVAIDAMIIGKAITIGQLNIAEFIIFSILTLLAIFFVIIVLKNIKKDISKVIPIG